MQTELQVKLRYLRVGPRKARLLVDLIRNTKVSEAISQLTFSSKNVAKPILKLLNSAVSNAVHNSNLDEETLYIKKAFVDGGPILYRWMPRAMGRATPIRKRTSHITLVVAGEVDIKKSKKNIEVEKESDKLDTELKPEKVKKIKNKK